MRFTIYTADCTGNERNAIYPNQAAGNWGRLLLSTTFVRPIRTTTGAGITSWLPMWR